jgi:N-acetylglutamate synthase-like GNAT family acetyltransferase
VGSTIREADRTEAELIAGIVRYSFRTVAERFRLTAENCPRHPSNCAAEWVESEMDEGVRYFVLKDDDGPCGCVALEQQDAETCYLERLGVLREHRHRGHGRALVQHALAEARRLGAKRVELAMIAGDTRLRRWYEEFGFHLKETRTFDHLPFEVAFMRMEV